MYTRLQIRCGKKMGGGGGGASAPKQCLRPLRTPLPSKDKKWLPDKSVVQGFFSTRVYQKHLGTMEIEGAMLQGFLNSWHAPLPRATFSLRFPPQYVKCGTSPSP